eukprot:2103382-Prorocentrum_lima.AAC.1
MVIHRGRKAYRDSIQQTGAPIGQFEPEDTVAEEDDPTKSETWTQQDLGRSLQLLRSQNVTL